MKVKVKEKGDALNRLNFAQLWGSSWHSYQVIQSTYTIHTDLSVFVLIFAGCDANRGSTGARRNSGKSPGTKKGREPQKQRILHGPFTESWTTLCSFAELVREMSTALLEE